jgi:hypothetical protein
VAFDLVVQSAESAIDQPITAHVMGGEHLSVREVALVGRGKDRRSLVVGGERAAQIEPGKC